MLLEAFSEYDLILSHRSVCRLQLGDPTKRDPKLPETVEERRDRILKSLGFPTAVELGHTLVAWAEWHEWAIATMTKAVVMLEGGPDTLRLHTKNSRFITCVVSPLHDTEVGANPGNAFHIHSVSVNNASDFDTGSPAPKKTWANGEDGRLMDMGKWLRSSTNPSFAGLVSVVYHIQDTGMAFTHVAPVYHSRAAQPLSDLNAKVCRDVVGMIKGTTNAGSILRVEKDDGVVPIPGVLRRKKKDWQWRSIFGAGCLLASWDHMGALMPPSTTKSGLKPQALFEKFATL
ncbi:uncharacterized protein BXZ73DRAFT_50691 [Epithele typhae]|uniref:uncharacterized protein n=1 Tax=Epithele typhae TaxID=378194 RepID=UPI002007A0A3|nr:uncharacterized protein BXZ73DRAFT_50691 [Epithele typhae]KAH9923918.1 hypothetical protein BXZ73DRAFT_50691 [Epithele typhae]